MKRILLLLIFLMLAACGSSDNEDAYLPSPYEEEVAEDIFDYEPETHLAVDFETTSGTFQHLGFFSTAQVQDRQYFFTSDDDAANLIILSDWERIIDKIGGLIDFETIPLEIFFYEEGAEHQRFDSGRNIFVNPYDINSFGRLLGRLNEARLPIWLYVGLEAGARADAGQVVPGLGLGHKPIAYFGDMSFAPITHGNPEQLNAIATAYGFVNFLVEGGNLAELARLYAAQETNEANEIAARLFYEFADKPMLTAFSLHFDGNLQFRGQQPTNVAYEYRITAYTDFGNYHFLFLEHSDALSIQTMQGYVRYFDDSAQFVKNFFAGFAPFDFRPVDIFIVYDGSALSPIDANLEDEWIRMFNFSNVSPTVFAHEIAHYISYWAQGNSFGNYWVEFEEGIAMALMSYRDIYEGLDKSYHWHREHRRSIFGSYADALNNIFGDDDTAEAAWDFLMADFDSIGLAHVMGYHWLRHRDFETRAIQLGSTFAEIGTHPTAGSFVLYLIENYGIENYMQVHFDRDSFEDVYGITINEMIARWQAFLDGFILGLGQHVGI